MAFRLGQSLNLFLPKSFNKGFMLKQWVQSIHGITQSPVRAETSVYKNLSLSMAALNINHVRIPPHIELPLVKIPPVSMPLKHIELPQTKNNIAYEEQTSVLPLEDPEPSRAIEKRAENLIKIRRKKMKKHKLKKLRKKMKFEWAKVRQRRELKKEKEFQAHLLENIRIAQSFDPAKYAAEKISRSKEIELPQVWYGVKYPEWVIKELIKEKEKKKKQKIEDEKRRASMSPYVKDYLENLPK